MGCSAGYTGVIWEYYGLGVAQESVCYKLLVKFLFRKSVGSLQLILSCSAQRVTE
jgi:hypothetical protein